METTTENIATVQGTKATTKKQAISKTYTLKQFGEMIKKLKELNWINQIDEKNLNEIKEKCKTEYVKSL